MLLTINKSSASIAKFSCYIEVGPNLINRSATNGAQSVHIGIPIVCWYTANPTFIRNVCQRGCYVKRIHPGVLAGINVYPKVFT